MDCTYLSHYLFFGGPSPQPTLKVGDVDCNGRVNIVDLTHLAEYLFVNGPPPCDEP
jgi:hypothetical protein